MKASSNINLKKYARGDIELFSLHQSGEEDILLRRSNIILNGGADLLARALAGEQFVNGMYLAYDNFDPPFADTTPPPERTASFYHDVGAGQTRGVIRVPTIARPSLSVSEGIYNNNQVTFTAITAGGPAISSPFNDLLDGVSMFYGAGLGWIDPAGDLSKDVLFSAVTFADFSGPTHYEKLAGAQIGLRWVVTFEAP